MFYDPRIETSGLPHNPFNSGCVPRPIGWISTVSTSGVHNLAPFSQFINVTYDPPTVLFISCGDPQTDSAINAVETGEFVWSQATYDQRYDVVKSATEYPQEIDEFERLDIGYLPSKHVAARRVKGSPMHFECKVTNYLDFPGGIPIAAGRIVIGEVIGIHIDDEYITPEGRYDTMKARPLARLGYLDYTSVESRFELTVPDFEDAVDFDSGFFHQPEPVHSDHSNL